MCQKSALWPALLSPALVTPTTQCVYVTKATQAALVLKVRTYITRGSHELSNIMKSDRL